MTPSLAWRVTECRLTHYGGPKGTISQWTNGPQSEDPSLPHTSTKKDCQFSGLKKRFLPWSLGAQVLQDPPEVDKGAL